MSQPIKLDFFEVVEFLGQGGMAEVWKGRHIFQKIPVAIKCMTGDGESDPSMQAAMREEIRAVARLNHPGIVRVLDSGTVCAAVEKLTNGRVREGSFYLAMELASGTLMDLDPESLSWPEQRDILRQILEALAHSHARRVIHRDLKPENVLFFEGRRIKLTDFGLANALQDRSQRGVTEQEILGTPLFMSPERVEGRWRDQGPWTDLYAVGCLAYWLVAGKAPFEELSPHEVTDAQLHRRPPPLPATTAVPGDFRIWLDGLLAKDSTRRYRRASDALHDLVELDDIVLSLSATASEGVELGKGVTALAETEAAVTPNVGAKPAPLALDWRIERCEPSVELVGVGLGLFGLRTLPLVGREEERDRIWQALRIVEQSKCPRAMILDSESGAGKSRLATWMAERAYETSGVTMLTASHSSTGGPGHGLARMVADHLACTGLDRSQIRDRIGGLTEDGALLSPLGAYERDVLTNFLTPVADPDYAENRQKEIITGVREARIVIRHVLKALTRHRPAILLLDDVHWGAQTLEFVDWLLQDSDNEKLPLLCLLTVQTGAEQEQPLTAKRLHHLRDRSEVDSLSVGPLSDEDHIALVEHILGLEPSLAAAVSRSSAGNPLFAVELVGDWVEQDLLKTTPEGFVLRTETEIQLPKGIHQLLNQRIDKLVSSFGEREASSVRQALELAAALGQEVEYREWWTACQRAGVSIPEALLEALLARHLAHRKANGWGFVHDALRECLVRQAKEAGRWQDYNECCAKMLQKFYGSEPSVNSQRIARHFLKARRWKASLKPLLQAAEYNNDTSRMESAHHFFAHYQEALDRLSVPEKDRRRVEGWHKQVVVYARQERFDESQELLRRSESVLRDTDWTRWIADLAYHKAWLLHLSGDPGASENLAQEAAEGFASVTYLPGLASALYLQGLTASWRGAMEKGSQDCQRAFEIYTQLGDEHGQAKCLISLGSDAGWRGDYEEAVRLIENGITIYEEMGDRYAQSVGYSNLGEVHRNHGELQKAREVLEMGYEIISQAGMAEVSLSLNLCCVLLDLEEYEQTEVILNELLPRFIKSSRGGILGIVYATLLPCHAAAGDWERWDESLVLAAGHLRENSIIDPDLAGTFELAANIAHEAGDVGRAKGAYEQALAQWKALEDVEKVAEINECLRE